MLTREDWTALLFDNKNMSFPIEASRTGEETSTITMNSILWKKDGFPKQVRYDYNEERVVVLDGEEQLYEFSFTKGRDFGQMIEILTLRELINQV